LDEPSSQPSSQLVLNFLTRFLQRYVPSMDKTPEVNDLEIEYDPKTKLRFSEELYDSLGKLFWRFWRFLGQVMEGTVNNLAYEEREEEVQALESVKLMLEMLGKLKIGSDEDVEAVLESLIVRMTPCPNEFSKFYVLTELMLEETHARSYCRHFSQEYLSHFSRIFQIVLSSPKMLQIYLKLMDKLYAQMQLKERPAPPARRGKENAEPGKGKYSGWLCRRVELVNRVSWNIVLSVNTNCDALAGFGLERWVSGYLRLIQEVEQVELKKCLSLNMKYLGLGYSPHFHSAQYHALLFAPLATSLSDHILEFLLALLASIFAHPLFAYRLIDQDQLLTLVGKVRHLEAAATFDHHFIRIYPALYALFVRMFEANQDTAVVSSLVKELRAPLLEDELHSLEQFARSEDEMDVPALKRTIFYF
jgi:hypothetical protein